jgi:alpha-galactosidase/6-phospho-beta-glucosidase family protein
MVKVALIGASSAVFARQIVTDILAIDGLDGGPPPSWTSTRNG